MHYFGAPILDRFEARIGATYKIRTLNTSSIMLARSILPQQTEVWVLPGNGF